MTGFDGIKYQRLFTVEDVGHKATTNQFHDTYTPLHIVCGKFVASIKLDNLLYSFIHKHSRILNRTYFLRSERPDRTTITTTDRFQNFVTTNFTETYVN